MEKQSQSSRGEKGEEGSKSPTPSTSKPRRERRKQNDDEKDLPKDDTNEPAPGKQRRKRGEEAKTGVNGGGWMSLTNDSATSNTRGPLQTTAGEEDEKNMAK